MREDTSDFADKLLRISHYCTEKYDLSFQLTYHTLAFDFQTTNAEEQALFDMSKIQQTVVLDLQTSNILISALPSIDQLILKTFLLKTKRYCCIRKYPSLAKNRGDQCSSPDIADHPSDTPRLLLSPSVPGSANFWT